MSHELTAYLSDSQIIIFLTQLYQKYVNHTTLHDNSLKSCFANI